MSISYMGKDPFPTVIIDADTLQQYKYIVNGLNIEAEWYGFVKYNEKANHLHIMGEAFIPDQVATGTSANATPAQIIDMLGRIDDYCEENEPGYDENDLGIHLHSHVRMDTFESQTDLKQKHELVEDYRNDYLNEDHKRTNRYLLKGIMNQHNDLFLEIIDLETLLVKECKWHIAMESDSLDRLDNDLKERIKKAPPQNNTIRGGNTNLKVIDDFDYASSFNNFDDFEFAHVTHVSSKQLVEVHVEDMLEILELLENTGSTNSAKGEILESIKEFVKRQFGKELFGNFNVRMMHYNLQFLVGEKVAHSTKPLLKADLDAIGTDIMYNIYGVVAQ